MMGRPFHGLMTYAFFDSDIHLRTFGKIDLMLSLHSHCPCVVCHFRRPPLVKLSSVSLPPFASAISSSVPTTL